MTTITKLHIIVIVDQEQKTVKIDVGRKTNFGIMFLFLPSFPNIDSAKIQQPLKIST